MRRIKWRYVGLAVLAVLVIGLSGFVVWANTPQGDLMDAAKAALESDESVRVDTSQWLVFEPVNADPTTGYIFYPGGRVQAEAYAPMARAIAEAGYLSVIVPVPLNLAFFNTGAAGPVIDAYPQIEHWAVAGHSLGGVAAAAFADENPDRVEAVLIMASFPAPWNDLSDQADLVVVSVYGTLDSMVHEIEDSGPMLPPDAQFIPIEGGNHAQFGYYGPQAGDNEATITRAEQQEQIIAATVAVLEQISGNAEDESG